MSSKGKAVDKGKAISSGKGSSGKRKRNDSDKSDGMKKRDRSVLQFVDDVAIDDDDDFDFSDISDFDDDFMDDEFEAEQNINVQYGKAAQLPLFPKEEELSEEELEKLFIERCKKGSDLAFAEDYNETKRSVHKSFSMPPEKDPIVWKVKCMVGRERHSAFCLMQKFIDLQSLGTKLRIISAFAVEHVKGFIFVEADKQCDVIEACKGLCNIYSSRLTSIPTNEIFHLVSVQSKGLEVSVGMWVRVKNGKYKGDLAQIVAVNDARKKATLKLVPRIDLQALVGKFGGGVTAKTTSTPAPRLISAGELEELRPLIQFRHDRDVGQICQVLDGMILKDGYLFKKVPLDSLSCWGVMPSEEELQRFKPPEKDVPEDLKWLSQLYGEPKKKRVIKCDKGDKSGGKGDGSSGSSLASSFELYDLVCFGRKNFGIIIATEKDNSYKILKYGSEGPVVATAQQRELKRVFSDKKFTAPDKRLKTIFVNDTVKVMEGPSQGRQGIVKQIYRGIVFLYDEAEEENSGYLCTKSQMCEKIKRCDDASKEELCEGGTKGFEDFVSSPRSPLSPKKSWQARENNGEFSRGDKDKVFSIGQTLRIKVGPLKGYLCRVIGIRYSDVTVKLASQQRVLTVKSEHLSDVHSKSSAFSASEDPESSLVKPFDLLESGGGPGDWTGGGGTSGEGNAWNSWNSAGPSAERCSWSNFPDSGDSTQKVSLNPVGSGDIDSRNDAADVAWECDVNTKQNSAWGVAVNGDGFGGTTSGSWGKPNPPVENQSHQIGTEAGDNWNKGKLKIGTSIDSSADVPPTWGKLKSSSENQDVCWGKPKERWNKGQDAIDGSTNPWSDAVAGCNQQSGGAGSWDKQAWNKESDKSHNNESTWGQLVQSQGDGTGQELLEGTWGKAAVNVSRKDNSGSEAGWNCVTAASKDQDEGSWGKPAENLSRKDNSGGEAGWNCAAAASKDQDGGSWGKTALNLTRKDNSGSEVGWNCAAAASKDRDEGSWGKTAENLSGKDISSGEAGWNCATIASKDQDGGSWGKTAQNLSRKDNSGSGAGWNSATIASKDQDGGWGKSGGDVPHDKGCSWRGGKFVDGSSVKNDSSWKNVGGDGQVWEKGGSSKGDSWSKPSKDGGSPWSNQEMASSFNKQQERPSWSNDGVSRQDNWKMGRTFDGDRGTGGRRGRGGRGRGGAFWDKNKEVGGSQEGGWGKSGDGFDNKEGFGGGSTRGWNGASGGGDCWGNEGFPQNMQKTRGKEKDETISELQNKNIIQGNQDSKSWGKWNSEAGNATEWTRQSASSETQMACWASASGNWGKEEVKGTAGWGNKSSAGEDAGIWGKDVSNNDQTSWCGQLVGSPRNKQDGESSSGKQDAESSWNTQTESVGNKKVEGSTGWANKASGNQSGTSGWDKPKTSAGDGISSWNKGGQSSWSRPQEPSSGIQEKESSWGKQGGGASSWNRQNESWGNKKSDSGDGSSGKKLITDQGQTDSWGKPKAFTSHGESSWDKGGESTWSQQESSSNKQGGESSWSKRDGAPSWNREGGRGSFWKKDDGNQQDSWERPRDFDGNRGFNRGRGRGGGGGRGRGQFGRGRSSWNNNNADTDGKNEQGSWGNEGPGWRNKSWGEDNAVEGKASDSQAGSWGRGSSDWSQKKPWSKEKSVEESSTWENPPHFQGQPGVLGRGPTESWRKDKDASSTWGVSLGSQDTKPASAWASEGSDQRQKGSWAKENDGGSSWGKVSGSQAEGKSKENDGGSWGKASGKWATNVPSDDQGGCWGKDDLGRDREKTEHKDQTAGGWGKTGLDQSSTWGKVSDNQAAGKWSGQEGSSGSLVGWKGVLDASGNQKGGWEKSSLGGDKDKAFSTDNNRSEGNQTGGWGQSSGWAKTQNKAEHQTSNWGAKW